MGLVVAGPGPQDAGQGWREGAGDGRRGGDQAVDDAVVLASQQLDGGGSAQNRIDAVAGSVERVPVGAA